MKIRGKLLFGFGLYILLAAILGFFAYKELRTIGARLTLVETADDMTNTILEVRRYEKNFLLYRDRDDFNELRKYLGILNKDIDNIKSEIIIEIGSDDFKIMRRAIADYEHLITAIARNGGAKDAEEKMRVTAREIQSFTQNLSKKERFKISTTITTSINLLLFALLLIITLGTIINVKLATSIATPIRTLEKIAKKIAEGDFSETIEVKGKDELASLETAFNQMEDKLKNALGSLEFAITRLREKQAQLVEAEKLAAVGKLAAGIAHEINNPLTSVLTFSYLMLEQCPKDDPRCKTLKMMTRETERARNIVRQLLNFGRETIIKPVKINVNQPVGEIIDSLIAQEAFKDISLKVDLAENLPDIHADPAQIGQVVLNMALNAIHAITPPGTIEISTRAKDRFVEIIFCDTGQGIPEKHLNKIFDPFFTTKDSSKGTGLGLAVSYGIIKKHDGDIAVMSTIGKGTTFIVRLPVSKA
jgi:signal transduction histidine kinase